MLDPLRNNHTAWESSQSGSASHHSHDNNNRHHHHRFRRDIGVADVTGHAHDVVDRAGSGLPEVLEVGALLSISDGVSVQGGAKVVIDFSQKSIATVGFLGGGLSAMVSVGGVPLPNIAADAQKFYNLMWKGEKRGQGIAAVTNGWTVGAGVSFTIPSPIPGVDFSAGAGVEFETGGIGQAPEWPGPLSAGFHIGVGVGLIEVRGTAEVTYLKQAQGPTVNCMEHTFTTACFIGSVLVGAVATDPIVAPVVAVLGIANY